MKAALKEGSYECWKQFLSMRFGGLNPLAAIDIYRRHLGFSAEQDWEWSGGACPFISGL